MHTRLTRSCLACFLRTGAIAALLLTAWPGAAHAQTAAAAGSSTRTYVEMLTSERFGGRQAGSEGERLAADYLVAQLTRIGAKPLPGRSDMFVPFEFTAGSRDSGSSLVVTPAGGEATTFRGTGAVQALAFSDTGTSLTGKAVFAGYGIVVPESQDFGYDSYAGIDVKGKIAVVLRYYPEDAEPDVKSRLARYSELRYKAMAARERGAIGLIVVTGPRSPNAGTTVPMTFDTALAGSGIPAVSVGAAVAPALFAGGKSLEQAQMELDSGNPHVAGFELTPTVALTAALVRERSTSRNVVAYLPATSPTAGVAKPWVAVGAHYDHLGRSGRDSLAASADAGRMHPGADDNASGAAAVLAIGEWLARQPRRRNVLLAFWAAEEIGLVGSGAFAGAPPFPLTELAAYLNYDMVGRMQDNRLSAQATGSSPVWPSMLERANVAAGFDVVLQPDPNQPTDVKTFNDAKVPSLAFTTGAHDDYHKPSDTADKINYADLDRLVTFSGAIVSRLMALDSPPEFTLVASTASPMSRDGMRIYTGTVPDYTATVKGLLLSGVGAGGPAEQAGLTKGDIIVEIAGRSIANVYDYTYALDVLKIGQPTKVVYMRNGERRETTLTPAARK